MHIAQKFAYPGSAVFHGGAASFEIQGLWMAPRRRGRRRYRALQACFSDERPPSAQRRAAVEGGATGHSSLVFMKKGLRPRRSKFCPNGNALLKKPCLLHRVAPYCNRFRNTAKCLRFHSFPMLQQKESQRCCNVSYEFPGIGIFDFTLRKRREIKGSPRNFRDGTENV